MIRRCVASTALLVMWIAFGTASCDRVPQSSHPTILIISDSNGIGSAAWPARVAAHFEIEDGRTRFRVLNDSRPGRTLLFDRGGEETSANIGIETWYERARPANGDPIAIVLIALGTNDAQSGFSEWIENQRWLESSLQSLLVRAKAVTSEGEVVVLSPPAVCTAKIEKAKRQGVARDAWVGARVRLQKIERALDAAAANVGASFISTSTLSSLDPCDATGDDGVHLNESGHETLARIVFEQLIDQSENSRGLGTSAVAR